jgi:hypothetical protein
VKLKRNYKKCDKCYHEYSLSCFNRHYKRCNGEANYWKKRTLGELTVDNNIVCEFCQKQCKNANSKRNHSRLCKQNPNKQLTHLQTHRETIEKGCNQYTKAKKYGLPKPVISNETRIKLSKANKSKSAEQRKEIAKTISETVTKKLHAGTWHTFRDCPDYHYKGHILNGSWELKYAQYLDAKNIKWLRCKTSFPYIYEDKVKRYTPDFYLIETEEYIEIKGYKTEKDDAKWSQFPKDLKLRVLFKEELKILGIDV